MPVKIKPLLVVLLLLNVNSLKAEEDDELTALLNMPIEQLLNIKVTSASKFEESIYAAHASISIITKEQIALFGGHYLADILERIVNVNHSYGVLSSITTRGSQPWTSLAHHLALLNGRPFGNLTGGHGLYSSIPLTSIEQIEYIRGPGSVLYGTNAYHGVFNIVTKIAQQQGWQGQQKLTYGSFNTRLFDGSFQYQQQQFTVAVDVLHADESGWQAKMFDPITEHYYERQVFRQERTLHINGQYHDFSFSHFRSRQQRFANFWDAPQANFIPWVKVHPVDVSNFGYNHKFNPDWRLETNVTLNRKTLEWSSNGIADELVRLKFPLSSNLFEFNLFGQINADSHFLAGFTREDRKVHHSYTIPDVSEDYASLYFQFKHQLTPSLNYMLGGQFVTSVNLKDQPDNKSNFVPRFGLIYDFNPNLSAKLLYGEAYRQPQAGERFISSPGIQKGTPDLDAELMATMEMQLFYQDSYRFATLTYYHNKESNLIQVLPSDDPLFALENKNQGQRTSNGVEFEFKYNPDRAWQLEFAWAWQQNQNEQQIKQTTLMPNSSWKLGLGYQFNGWQLGIYNIHNDDFQDTTLLNPASQNINPKAKGFDWLTLKASSQVMAFGKTIELSLELKNILNEQVYFPNDTPVFFPSNTLPGRGGFSAFLNLNLNW